MLTMVFLLAIMSTVLELMIAANIPWWRQWSHKSKLFNLLNSMFLSYFIGLAFGAQGLIALTAGVLSTFLTIPGYSYLNWNYDSEVAKTKYEGNRYKYVKKTAKPKVAKAKELGSDLIKVGYVTGKVITAPLWISRRIYKYCKS